VFLQGVFFSVPELVASLSDMVDMVFTRANLRKSFISLELLLPTTTKGGRQGEGRQGERSGRRQGQQEGRRPERKEALAEKVNQC